MFVNLACSCFPFTHTVFFVFSVLPLIPVAASLPHPPSLAFYVFARTGGVEAETLGRWSHRAPQPPSILYSFLPKTGI